MAEKAGGVAVRLYRYDRLGRQDRATVVLPRPTTGVTGAAPSVVMDFTYDDNGNRTGASWSGGTISWLYDGLNRVKRVSLGQEEVVSHQYDPLGRRVGTVRGAASSTYLYDLDNRLTYLDHVWPGGSLSADYHYDDAGQLDRESLNNPAFLWQPPAALTKTTSYAPASPINALTKVNGVTQTHDARGNRKVATNDG